MTEKQLHEAVADYIRMQYPKTKYKTDLSGIYLGGKWSLMNFVKRTTSSPGFPDLVIYEVKRFDPLPAIQYHGLAIELKAEGNSPFKKDGTLKSDPHLKEQQEWLDHFTSIGFKSTFAIGFDEAKRIVDEYLGK